MRGILRPLPSKESHRETIEKTQRVSRARTCGDGRLRELVKRMINRDRIIYWFYVENARTADPCILKRIARKNGATLSNLDTCRGDAKRAGTNLGTTDRVRENAVITTSFNRDAENFWRIRSAFIRRVAVTVDRIPQRWSGNMPVPYR
jgi:hypothetical protein